MKNEEYKEIAKNFFTDISNEIIDGFQEIVTTALTFKNCC